MMTEDIFVFMVSGDVFSLSRLGVMSAVHLFVDAFYQVGLLWWLSW